MRSGKIVLLIGIVGLSACEMAKDEKVMADSVDLPVPLVQDDSSQAEKMDTANLTVTKMSIKTGEVQPGAIVDYAGTLIGTKYKYGSTDPSQGFDCSGFITYVFNHFGIAVPRSSIDFTDVGRTIPYDSARAGDLILFTGTDSTEQHVGHMGIIVGNNNGIVEFIHSTSGKAYGVTITALSGYYLSRYVRTARIFHQNELSN